MASHLAKASDLSPPATSAAAAQQWVAAADQLMQQSASFREAFVTKLKQCEEEVEQAVQAAFGELKQKASHSRLSMCCRKCNSEQDADNHMMRIFSLATPQQHMAVNNLGH